MEEPPEEEVRSHHWRFSVLRAADALFWLTVAIEVVAVDSVKNIPRNNLLKIGNFEKNKILFVFIKHLDKVMREEHPKRDWLDLNF